MKNGFVRISTKSLTEPRLDRTGPKLRHQGLVRWNYAVSGLLTTREEAYIVRIFVVDSRSIRMATDGEDVGSSGNF